MNKPIIIHESGLVELYYDISSDILSISWPDLNSYSMVEIEYSFNLLIQTLKNYDVKKILIDSTHTISDINNEEYQALVNDFSKNLTTTRLQKMARLVSQNQYRETQVVTMREKLVSEIKFDFEYQSFTDKELALNWLKQK